MPCAVLFWNGIVCQEKTLDTSSVLCYPSKGDYFMETKLKQAYLYDFYGELLNAHQRKIYEDFYFNDLSLTEIAGEEGISRQGVHDLVKRSTKILEEYERKLHLVEKFLYIKDKTGAIQRLMRSCNHENQERVKTEIIRISDEILEGL